MFENQSRQEEIRSTVMREYFLRCKRTGEPPRLMPEAHTREKVLDQIQQWLKEGAPECSDILWVIPEDVPVEKGIYAWNRAGEDQEVDCYLAVVAQAPLMAFVMGEYELAMQWYTRYGREPEEKAVELSFSRQASYVECGSYTLEMAWLLAEELDNTEDFFERLCVTSMGLSRFRESLYSFCFQWGHRYDKRTPIHRFCRRRERGENVDRVLPFLVYYILWHRMDFVKDVWEMLFDAFSDPQERMVIVSETHAFLCCPDELAEKYGAPIHKAWEHRCMERVLEVYGRYERTLFLSSEIVQYLEQCVEETRRGMDSLDFYFRTILCRKLTFAGEVSSGWKGLMHEVLMLGDVDAIFLGFRCGFLRQELIDEYLKECTGSLAPACLGQVVPLLMVQNWQIGDRVRAEEQESPARVKLCRCIHHLKCTYPWLDYPLSHMKFLEGGKGVHTVAAFYTDGLRIYYRPGRVEALLMRELEYGIMHILLHGLLGHFIRRGLFTHQDISGQVMDAQVLYALHQIGGDMLLNGREKDAFSTIGRIFHHEISLLAYDEIMGSDERQAEMIVYVNHGKYDDHGSWSREYAKIKDFWQEMIGVVFGPEFGAYLENTEKNVRILEALILDRIKVIGKEE